MKLYYFHISIINSPLEPLTYHFLEDINIGTKVKVTIQKRVVCGVVLANCDKPNFKTNPILEITSEYYSQKQLSLAKFISTYYICSFGDAISIAVAFSHDIYDKPLLSHVSSDIVLSKEQEEAFLFIKKHKISLLFGDTGSGKTEIYMKYFQQMIDKGKRSIFLVPEISLTPQMEARLKNHFKHKVVIWHSKLTPKQKKEALTSMYSGEAYIVAGPRSALFLPIKKLGLIVVDEEHDNSYKSSSRPRYNARDVAIYMGKMYDIQVLLGSATPSLKTYVKFPTVRLRGGFFTSNKKFVYEASPESLSPLVLDTIKKTLQKQQQVIVFIPTRANFKHLICGDCGYDFKCEFCSIGMSVHQNINAMKCHYCNYTQAIAKRCPNCGGGFLTTSRLGTAQALQELQEKLPNAKIEQFDRDTITTSAKLKKALKRFNDKKCDILVGTQMLSKGHDYHGVTLAVVLGLDNILNMGDYQAREKALSMLIQVSGRSGRKKDATVLVQSFNQDFFDRYIDDYEDFLKDEKRYRNDIYPPYKKLCRVLFAHKNSQKAKQQMQTMRDNLCAFYDIEIVGFGECGIKKVANKYRFEILLRSDKSTSLIKAIVSSQVPLAEVDMDPIEFG